MADDDDLRFGDVGDNDDEGMIESTEDFAPIVVGVMVAAFLLVGQPLTANFGGLSMNIVGAVVCLVGGILGTFQ
jgi:hypothetical protein